MSARASRLSTSAVGIVLAAAVAPRRELSGACATGSASTGRTPRSTRSPSTTKKIARRPERARAGHGLHGAQPFAAPARGQGAARRGTRRRARRSRSSTSIRSAIRRAPRRSSRRPERPGEHGRVPQRRPPEVRRGGQARRLRLRGSRDGRRSERQGIQGRGSLHVRDPVRDGGPKQPSVYFTKGHGEGAIDSSERGRGFADAKQILERSNMTVGAWDSLGKADLPADADLIVVAGPPHGVPGARGGRAREIPGRRRPRRSCCSTRSCPGPGAPPLGPRIRRPARQVRHQARRRSRRRPGQRAAHGGRRDVLANHYGSSPIVSRARRRGAPGDLSAGAVGDEGGQAARGPRRDDARRDLAGGMGRDEPEAASTRRSRRTRRHARARLARRRPRARPTRRRPTRRPTRLVVIGNSRFAANGAIENGANGMLFANAAHWLAGSEKQVGIAPKTPRTVLPLPDGGAGSQRSDGPPSWACPRWPCCSGSGSGTAAGTEAPEKTRP